jgi:D-lyxose ketol-isomerase
MSIGSNLFVKENVRNKEILCFFSSEFSNFYISFLKNEFFYFKWKCLKYESNVCSQLRKSFNISNFGNNKFGKLGLGNEINKLIKVEINQKIIDLKCFWNCEKSPIG